MVFGLALGCDGATDGGEGDAGDPGLDLGEVDDILIRLDDVSVAQ